MLTQPAAFICRLLPLLAIALNADYTTSLALAQSLRQSGTMPTHGFARHCLSLSPICPGTGGNSTSLELGFNQQMKTLIPGNEFTADRHLSSQTFAGLFRTSFSGLQLALHADRQEIMDEEASSDDEEVATLSSLNPNLSFSLTSGFRFGIGVHRVQVKSSGMAGQEIDGTLLAWTAGIHLGDAESKLDVFYIAPFRGKVDSVGESLVATATGVVGMSAAWSALGGKLGGSLQLLQHPSESDSIPISIFESRSFQAGDALMGVGYEKAVGSSKTLRVAILRQSIWESENRTVDLEDDAPQYVGKVALGIANGAVESALGLNLFFRDAANDDDDMKVVNKEIYGWLALPL